MDYGKQGLYVEEKTSYSCSMTSAVRHAGISTRADRKKLMYGSPAREPVFNAKPKYTNALVHLKTIMQLVYAMFHEMKKFKLV